MINKDKEELILKKARNILNYPNTIGYEVDRDKEILAVFVKQKVDEEELEPHETLPKRFEGLTVDVVVEDMPTATHQNKHDPLVGGISIGPIDRNSAGTLGLVFNTNLTVFELGDKTYNIPEGFYHKHKTFLDTFFNKTVKNTKVGITNEHVAGNNKKVVQPGRLDSRTIREVGRVSSVGNLEAGKLDISVITLDDKQNISESVYEANWNGEYVSERPSKGTPVVKSGRTTGVTSSEVRNDNTTIKVRYDSGIKTMENVVRCNNKNKDFVDSGDSGSGVFDEDGNLLGFVFAASKYSAYYISMDNILKKYNDTFKTLND